MCAGYIKQKLRQCGWGRFLNMTYLIESLGIKRVFNLWSVLPHPTPSTRKRKETSYPTLHAAFFSRAGFLTLRKRRAQQRGRITRYRPQILHGTYLYSEFTFFVVVVKSGNSAEGAPLNSPSNKNVSSPWFLFLKECTAKFLSLCKKERVQYLRDFNLELTWHRKTTDSMKIQKLFNLF